MLREGLRKQRKTAEDMPRPFPSFLFAAAEACGVGWLVSYLILPEPTDSQNPLILPLCIGLAITLHTLILARKHSSWPIALGGLVGFLLYTATVIVVRLPT